MMEKSDAWVWDIILQRKLSQRNTYLDPVIHTPIAPFRHGLKVSYNLEDWDIECDAYSPRNRREGPDEGESSAEHSHTVMPLLTFEHIE